MNKNKIITVLLIEGICIFNIKAFKLADKVKANIKYNNEIHNELHKDNNINKKKHIKKSKKNA